MPSAGLVPIAVGYLIAHYLTYLLGEGQRIIIAVSDPFQYGWDLFGTVFYEPSIEWVQQEALWTVMMLAVIGGHIAGAWAGHLAAVRDRPGPQAEVRSAQMPLAALMVVLTTLTLWSLGQEVAADGAGTEVAGDSAQTAFAEPTAPHATLDGKP